MGNVGIYIPYGIRSVIAEGDFCGGFVGPGEKEPQIVGVMKVGSGAGMLPPQMLLKFFNFGEHFYLLMVKWFRTSVGSKAILPPRGILLFWATSGWRRHCGMPGFMTALSLLIMTGRCWRWKREVFSLA